LFVKKPAFYTTLSFEHIHSPHSLKNQTLVKFYTQMEKLLEAFFLFDGALSLSLSYLRSLSISFFIHTASIINIFGACATVNKQMTNY